MFAKGLRYIHRFNEKLIASEAQGNSPNGPKRDLHLDYHFIKECLEEMLHYFKKRKMRTSQNINNRIMDSSFKSSNNQNSVSQLSEEVFGQQSGSVDQANKMQNSEDISVKNSYLAAVNASKELRRIVLEQQN